MTADVSAGDRRPPTSIRDSGGSMPFSEADFTRDAARLVAEGDRVPAQRAYADRVARRITDPEFDQESYELGYREGGSNALADLAAALDELCDVPDDVDEWSPWAVARWVASLQGRVDA